LNFLEEKVESSDSEDLDAPVDIFKKKDPE